MPLRKRGHNNGQDERSDGTMSYIKDPPSQTGDSKNHDSQNILFFIFGELITEEVKIILYGRLLEKMDQRFEKQAERLQNENEKLCFEPLLEANHEGGTFRELCHVGTYLVNVCTTVFCSFVGTFLN